MSGAAISGAVAAACTFALLHPLMPRRVRSIHGALPPRRPPAPRRSRWRAHRTTSAEPWADLLDTIAADVRAGSSLSVAIEHAAATSTTGPDAAVALHSMGVAATLGGPVALTLQHGSLVLRDRHAARAEALAHSAQARLSATVLTVLPIAFTVVAFATSDSFRGAAVSQVGTVAIALGLGLNLAGRWWMARLVRRGSG